MGLSGTVRRSCVALSTSCLIAGVAHAQQPAAPTDAPGAPGSQVSLILTTITVPIAVVARNLEAAVPKTGSGTVANPVKKPMVINDVLTWKFTRSALQTKGTPGALLISSSISGTTHLKGTFRLGGDLRRLIGSVPDFPFSGTTTIRATSSARAEPQLLPNWRVQPNLKMSAQVQQATVPIKHLGTISIRGHVQSQFDAKLAELRRQLEARMRDDRRIEIEARKAWDKFCQAHPLDIDGDGKPDLHLRVTPLVARAAQPRIDENAVVQQVGIEARTEIGHDATKPDCPFPETVQLQPMGEPRFDIALPIEIGFEQLNTLLGTQLPKAVESAEYGLKAEIRKVAIGAADSKRLSLAVDGTVTETRSGTGKVASGTFRLRATPKLDAARQRITFENAELDPASLEVFGLTGVLARGAARLVERAIADLEIDVQREVAKLPVLAEEAVRTLNQAKGAEVEIAARFDPPKLVGLEFDDRKLRLIAQARGQVTATVRTEKIE